VTTAYSLRVLAQLESRAVLVGHQPVTVVHQSVTGGWWQTIPPAVEPRPTLPRQSRTAGAVPNGRSSGLLALYVLTTRLGIRVMMSGGKSPLGLANNAVWTARGRPASHDNASSGIGV